MCCVGLAAPAVAATPTVKSGVEAWQKGDHAGGVAIWRNLAEKGDADAAFNLGQAYRLGRGVPADSALAKKWFEAAANKGHVDAQVSLGLLLFDSGDRAAAMSWLKKAADKGEPRAPSVVGTACSMATGSGRTRSSAMPSSAARRRKASHRPNRPLAEMDKIMTLDETQARRGPGLDMAKCLHCPA